MADRALTLEERAVLDQVLIGLRDVGDLPGADGDVYTDEEGTPVARRDRGEVVALAEAAWPRPADVRSDAPVVIARAEQLPAAPLPPDTVLLLPAGGARVDDHRRAAWAAAWTGAATTTVQVPVTPAESEGVADRLAAVYSTGDARTVETVPQPSGDGRAVMLTGLSGSGKSTIAKALVARLAASRSVTLLDGDVVRTHLSKGLGFSREDRDTNIRRIGWVAAEVAKHGGIAVCAPIAPYDETRRWVRAAVEATAGPGAFLLVWVSTPLEVCEQRDVKGLYAKARAGEITGFTGIDDPYEPPADAELVIDASLVPVPEAVAMILARLTQ